MYGSTCASSFTCESAVLIGIKKLAIFIRYLRRFGMTGSRFHVYLRLCGAIAVEFSDESLRYERVTSPIGRNPAKALRPRL
jgi:hypothetical protein